MESILRIFVTDHCPGCVEARGLAAHIEVTYPGFKVEVIDIDDEGVVAPEAVFATPTYMLNDRVVSLGNPSLVEIERWIEEATMPAA